MVLGISLCAYSCRARGTELSNNKMGTILPSDLSPRTACPCRLTYCSLHWAAFVRLIDVENQASVATIHAPSRASAGRLRQQYSGHSIASLWFIGYAAALRNAFGIDSVHYPIHSMLQCFYSDARICVRACVRAYMSLDEVLQSHFLQPAAIHHLR